jgi:autotransporter-associated beta strand protein
MLLRILLFCSLGLIPNISQAQLRILDYNVGAASSTSFGPRPGMDDVLQAINTQNKAGFSRNIDIMVLQEGHTVTTTGQAYADLLNSLAGTSSYLPTGLNGVTTGGGRPMAVYNSATVTLIEEVAIGSVSTSGQPRQTLRYTFRPVGYDPTAVFYVYDSHFKAANDSTSANRRNVEAETIRTDSDALGPNQNVIYAGDLNLYKASEPAFQTLTAPGNGQAFDPLDEIGNWSNNAAFKPYHTQSPASTAAYPGQATGGMDDRFDFQLVTGAWLDGRGLDYISGSYWAFGNTGTHTMNQAITTGSPSALQAYLPGYTVTQAGNILTNLAQVADHLPVVADYQIPAKMSASLSTLPARVITGAVVAGTLSVSNSAPVSVSQGADRLDYGYSSSGMLSGSGTGSDMALGSVKTHSIQVNTSQIGPATGSVDVLATSPQTASPTFTQPVTMGVLGHATGSFSPSSLITTLDVDFGTLTQGTGAANQSFSIYNMPGALGPDWTARLDLDAFNSSGSGLFSTTLSPFVNLPAGNSLEFGLSLSTTTVGLFEGSYLLGLSDEDLPGATNQSLSINVRGSVVSPEAVLFDVASGTETQTGLGYGSITGPTSVTKTGEGTILLDVMNTFTGSMSIEQGTLALATADAVADSANIDLSPGAVFDVAGLPGGYTLADGQTISGSGTILGSITFGRGSTLSPGMASVASDLAESVAVPEPSLWILVSSSVLCFAMWRRHQRLIRDDEPA